MSTFKFQGYDIYYEQHGEGYPLVVLNGIFMSCASWSAFLPSFKSVALILIDLLDQGRSGKASEQYDQSLQARLVVSLLDHLNMESADIMGISYGGEVALHLAVSYPERVRKLVLSNTCAYTSPWLRDIGRSWEYAFASRDGRQFFKTCIPIVYSPKFYENNYVWASAREEMFVRSFTPDVYEAFSRLTKSAENYDVRDGLSDITARTLVISAEQDFVTPVHQQKELAASIPGVSWALIPDAGHAVMYEKPEAFASLVLGFVQFGDSIKTL
ncbi:dihydrolipoamide acetyltransferase [Clostridia bacterium]|nr:dihydrolipoamide acetyltransferase [Clostridia bacterium]